MAAIDGNVIVLKLAWVGKNAGVDNLLRLEGSMLSTYNKLHGDGWLTPGL